MLQNLILSFQRFGSYHICRNFCNEWCLSHVVRFREHHIAMSVDAVSKTLSSEDKVILDDDFVSVECCCFTETFKRRSRGRPRTTQTRIVSLVVFDFAVCVHQTFVLQSIAQLVCCNKFLDIGVVVFFKFVGRLHPKIINDHGNQLGFQLSFLKPFRKRGFAGQRRHPARWVQKSGLGDSPPAPLSP